MGELVVFVEDFSEGTTSSSLVRDELHYSLSLVLVSFSSAVPSGVHDAVVLLARCTVGQPGEHCGAPAKNICHEPATLAASAYIFLRTSAKLLLDTKWRAWFLTFQSAHGVCM